MTLRLTSEHILTRAERSLVAIEVGFFNPGKALAYRGVGCKHSIPEKL